jgi:hypothetical protein
MNPLEAYYFHQAGRGRAPGIGPVYAAPLYLQRGHGIGNLFGSLIRWVRPLLWSGAKDVGRETFRTGGKILADMAENTSPDVSTKDIESKHVSESAKNLIVKLRDRCRKRLTAKSKKQENKKPTTRIKREIFSYFSLVAL